MVPDSELVVAREAHANNTSKYLLNGRTSNFTEVTEIFKGKGVDLDNNRFLILQARTRTHAHARALQKRPRPDAALRTRRAATMPCRLQRASDARPPPHVWPVVRRTG